MKIFADWVGIASAIGTLIAAIAAAVAAGIAAYTAHQNRVTAEASVKSAQATEKAADATLSTAEATARAALANIRTADLMQEQLEQQRTERDQNERRRRRTVLLIVQEETIENIARCEDEDRLWEPLSLSEWKRLAEELALLEEDIFLTVQSSEKFIEQVNRQIRNMGPPIPFAYEIKKSEMEWLKNHKRTALESLRPLNGKINLALEAGVREAQRVASIN